MKSASIISVLVGGYLEHWDCIRGFSDLLEVRNPAELSPVLTAEDLIIAACRAARTNFFILKERVLAR